MLRRYAFLFALRDVRKGGMYHAEFQKLLGNSGGKKTSALTAIRRKRSSSCSGSPRSSGRASRWGEMVRSVRVVLSAKAIAAEVNYYAEVEPSMR